MRVLKQLTAAAEACCPFGYLSRFNGWTVAAAAERLGVCDKTFQNWRAAARKKQCKCLRRADCVNGNLARSPGKAHGGDVDH